MSVPDTVREARKTLPDAEWRSYAPERNAQLQFESEMAAGRCVWFPALARLMQHRHVPYVAERWRLADNLDGSIERGDVQTDTRP